MGINMRDVVGKIFYTFKAYAVLDKITFGNTLIITTPHWIEEKSPKKSFLKLTPVDWGEKTEQSSSEIDQFLYLRKLRL